MMIVFYNFFRNYTCIRERKKFQIFSILIFQRFVAKYESFCQVPVVVARVSPRRKVLFVVTLEEFYVINFHPVKL